MQDRKDNNLCLRLTNTALYTSLGMVAGLATPIVVTAELVCKHIPSLVRTGFSSEQTAVCERQLHLTNLFDAFSGAANPKSYAATFYHGAISGYENGLHGLTMSYMHYKARYIILNLNAAGEYTTTITAASPAVAENIELLKRIEKLPAQKEIALLTADEINQYEINIGFIKNKSVRATLLSKLNDYKQYVISHCPISCESVNEIKQSDMITSYSKEAQGSSGRVYQLGSLQAYIEHCNKQLNDDGTYGVIAVDNYTKEPLAEKITMNRGYDLQIIGYINAVRKFNLNCSGIHVNKASLQQFGSFPSKTVSQSSAPPKSDGNRFVKK